MKPLDLHAIEMMLATLCTHAVTGRAASIAWFCVSVWFGLCMVADVWVEWKKGKSE